MSARILECKQCISELIEGSVVTSTLMAATVPTASATCNQPKLPKLTLPRFKGMDHILGFVQIRRAQKQ